ncbi:hypothetical protein [Vibrio chagasii]|uniref:hypothetical protein n=1 Tax=Vibrio chagasii TaxID=170679 RepID=UPI0014772692|nr:hypothetical protein [Vibrio chagasii]
MIGETHTPNDVSKFLPYEERTRLEKSIKAATLLEQIAQFTDIEAQSCSTLGI